MPKFSFTKLVDIDRDKFFAISTDYERFTEILPEYFLELKIVERDGVVHIDILAQSSLVVT